MAKQHQTETMLGSDFRDCARTLRELADSFDKVAEEISDGTIEVKAMPTLRAGIENVHTGLLRANEAIQIRNFARRSFMQEKASPTKSVNEQLKEEVAETVAEAKKASQQRAAKKTTKKTSDKKEAK